MVKRICAMILVLAVAWPVVQASAATERISVLQAPLQFVVDGERYNPPADQDGFLYDSSTYVPLRFVASILGRNVDWDGTTATVRISEPKNVQWGAVKQYMDTNRLEESALQPLDKAQIKAAEIDVLFADVTYYFDGVQTQPPADKRAINYKGSIFLPLRFVYESLGYDPQWDSSYYSIATASDERQLELQSIAMSSEAADIYALDKTCTDDITKLAISVGIRMGTNNITQEEIDANLATGLQMLDDCRQQVDELIAALAVKLEAAGFSASITEDYRVYFDNKEQTARNQVMAILQK